MAIGGGFEAAAERGVERNAHPQLGGELGRNVGPEGVTGKVALLHDPILVQVPARKEITDFVVTTAGIYLVAADGGLLKNQVLKIGVGQGGYPLGVIKIEPGVQLAPGVPKPLPNRPGRVGVAGVGPWHQVKVSIVRGFARELGKLLGVEDAHFALQLLHARVKTGVDDRAPRLAPASGHDDDPVGAA